MQFFDVWDLSVRSYLHNAGNISTQACREIEMLDEGGNSCPFAVLACFSGVKIKGNPSSAGVGK
jgi:hypothetical protein